jgi:hypothetical protein
MNVTSFNMTAVVNQEIYIKEHTLIHLFLDNVYVGSTPCKHAGTYQMNGRYYSPQSFAIRWEKTYPIIQTFDGKSYNKWAVWEDDPLNTI